VQMWQGCTSESEESAESDELPSPEPATTARYCVLTKRHSEYSTAFRASAVRLRTASCLRRLVQLRDMAEKQHGLEPQHQRLGKKGGPRNLPVGLEASNGKLGEEIFELPSGAASVCAPVETRTARHTAAAQARPG
jgi:hypothetical protein